jgi:hypothetical protein
MEEKVTLALAAMPITLACAGRHSPGAQAAVRAEPVGVAFAAGW